MDADPQAVTAKTSLWGDVLGGLAAMLVALPSSVAFGVLAYGALGREYAGAGAMAGIVGAAALGLVAPAIGRNAGLISAPCAPAAAVLTALIVDLASGKSGPPLAAGAILPVLALTALGAAVLQILYGALGGGRLIKFIPYPVVSGYLSGVAVLIALGQIPKLFAFPKGTPLFHGLASPELWRWQGVVVGVVTIAVMSATPYLTKKIPAAILGIAGGIASYFFLAWLYPPLLTIENNPLVIGPIRASGSFLEAISLRVTSLGQCDLAALERVVVPALTLSVLLSIDTLKTCVGLDALTHNRHQSDRELVGQGVGNLVSFLTGGMPGAGTMGPSLVNVTSGGKSYRSGIIEGAFVVVALLLLGKVIAWVPISALAGILLVIAWRMFDKGMFHLLRHPAGRFDFAVIAAVILTAVAFDLIMAAGIGVGMAILLFIRDQIRGTVIRRKMYVGQIKSKTRRSPAEEEVLSRCRELGVFCELQGNLFFGTTDQLFTHLEKDLQNARFILMDMRRVQSMDYTAAHLFDLMQARLAQRGGQLLFCGMPSALLAERNFELYMISLGVISTGRGGVVSDTLDSALEWIEERILEGAGVGSREDESLLSVEDFRLFRGLEGVTLAALGVCMLEKSYGQGERIFSQGDEGEEIFFVRRGSVRIMLPLEGGKLHHLATVSRGNFFGELSFLDRRSRSAHVEAKTPTDLYVLSRSRLEDYLSADATLGVKIFGRLSLVIAERLRQTDEEMQDLFER